MHAINKGVKLGVSIGGTVVRAGMRWAEELNRAVYTYFDIALKEISVTSSPAVPDTWIGRITRSINRNEVTMNDNEQAQPTKVEVEVETPTAPQNPPTDTTPAPAPEPEGQAQPASLHPDTHQPEGEEVGKTEAPEGEDTPAPAPDEDAPEEQAEEEAGEAATTPSDPPQTDAPAGDRPSEEAQKALDLFKAEELNKRAELLENIAQLQDREAEMRKSLTAKDEEITTLRKSLEETTAKVGRLETELAEESKKNARKVYAYTKAGTVEEIDTATAKTTHPDITKMTAEERQARYWAQVLRNKTD